MAGSWPRTAPLTSSWPPRHDRGSAIGKLLDRGGVGPEVAVFGDAGGFHRLNPSLVPLAQGDGVEVVDAVTSAAFGQDETGADQHREMLHDRIPAQLREHGSKFAGRRRPGPEPVEDAPAPRAGQRPPDVGLSSGLVSYDGIP